MSQHTKRTYLTLMWLMWMMPLAIVAATPNATTSHDRDVSYVDSVGNKYNAMLRAASHGTNSTLERILFGNQADSLTVQKNRFIGALLRSGINFETYQHKECYAITQGNRPWNLTCPTPVHRRQLKTNVAFTYALHSATGNIRLNVDWNADGLSHYYTDSLTIGPVGTYEKAIWSTQPGTFVGEWPSANPPSVVETGWYYGSLNGDAGPIVHACRTQLAQIGYGPGCAIIVGTTEIQIRLDNPGARCDLFWHDNC